MDTMEILKNLTADQQESFIKLEETFGTDGWGLLKKWAEDRAVAAKDRAAYAGSWEENRIAVGAEQVYLQIASLGDSFVTEFAELAEANMLSVRDDPSDFDPAFE